MQKTSKIKFQEYQFAATKEESYQRAERAIQIFQNKNLPRKKDGTQTTAEELVHLISSIQIQERTPIQHTMSTISFGAIGGGSNRDSGSGFIVRGSGDGIPLSITTSSSGVSITSHSNSHFSGNSSSNNSHIVGGGNRSSGTHLAAASSSTSSNLNNSSGMKESTSIGSNLSNSASSTNNNSSTTTTIDFEFQLSFTQLVTLPPSVYGLVWLQKLVLTHHNIKTLSEDIGKLQQLQVLVLDNNRLVGLPSAVGDLVNLKRLEADNNLLVSLCSLERLSKLEVLSLNNNKLTLLPTSIASLSSLKTLNIKQNPIITPPTTVVSKGLKDIIAFLRELETGARPCLRSKLVVVGDEKVGKSSVIQCIRGKKKKSSNQMEGIEIDQHEFDVVFEDDADRKRKTITVSTWDIANQDVYFTTNQLFASDRTVYVIVFDLTKSIDNSNIEYWLHTITSVAPNSPIVLVGTHIDEFEDLNKVAQTLEKISHTFQKNFPNIQAIISVSCTTGYDVDRLRQLVEDIIKTQPYLRTKVPSSFFTLEEALIEMRKKRTPPVMTWPEYTNLVGICNLKDTVQVQRATEFLHNIGSIIYFNDPNSTVGKMVILDHQWIINSMTALINGRSIASRSGIIRQGDLSNIWKPPYYPDHMHTSLMAIMQAFEISYPLTHSQPLLIKEQEQSSSHPTSIYPTVSSLGLKSEESETRHLIPTLLSKDGNLVSQWEDFDCPDKIRLNRQYHLPYIPEKFFAKLIIRLLHFVQVEACLKNVVAVRNQQGQDALIELKNIKGSKTKVLIVNVRGLPKPVGLLRILTDTIESLFSQWYKLDIKRYVSCFECSFLYDQNPTLFPIEDCEEAVMDGKTVLNCFRKHDQHDEKATHRLPLDILVPDIAMVDIPRPRFDLKEIKIIKEVGQGAFGVVYEAEWNGEIVALKKLIPPTGAISDSLTSEDEKKEDRLRVFREFRHEVYSMSRLNHPNLMKISGFCIQPLCMALEYVKYGSLYTLLANNLIEIGWGLRLQIATEIAKGMQHMHSLNPPMMHRDLKSPNILMHGVVEGSNPVSTIIDYGTSTELYGGAALARCVDQPLWLAPEVMASMAYSEPSDVYAFGIILWELYTRSHPFDEYSFGQWMSKLEDEIIRGLRPTIPASCPPEYVELIQSCWTHEPNSRPTFTSIVESLATLKKKLVPIQSTLPPHIRNQARKSRSASFSEWSSTSVASGLGASLTSSSLSQSREQLSASITTQVATFNHTTSSSSMSSNGDSDDAQLTLDDLISLEIFTEEEMEQPYPFVDDDQRGILFGYDEEQTSSVSIVTAATLAKMIEMMTRNDGGASMPSSSAIQQAGTSANTSAASGRKRSDTAGKSGLPVPQWRNSLPLSPNGNITTLDESFIEDFIHLYRSFTTPVAVLKLLVKRFFGPRGDKSDTLTMRKFEQRRSQIRVGISNFLKRWCVDITEIEYHQDGAWLYHKVDEFVHLCYGSEPAIINSIGTILDSFDPEIKKAKEDEKMEFSTSLSKMGARTSTDVGRSGSFSLSSAATLQLNISKSFINLAIAIKDPLYGVPLRERKFKNKVVTRCFSGSEAVDWICRITSSSRDDANTLAIDLFTRHFFFILGEDGTPTISKGGNRNEFYDSLTQFYAFHDDDPELIAHQYTFLELDYLQQIHPRELLGYSVGLAANEDQPNVDKAKQLNFPNICNYFQWFQKMTLLAASEIVKQRDIKPRAEMIERYIKIALEYLSLWNFNGVMQVLSALHSDPVTRLLASWARVPQKYIDAFNELSRLMLPESNYLPLRMIISSLPGSITQTYPTLAPYMTHVICPTVPFLGALVADLSQTSTENPTFVSSGGEKMTNILRVKRLSKKMKMFKEYKEMPSVYRPQLTSTPYVWYGGYMNEIKAFDYNQIDRLSEFERTLEIEAEKNGTLGDDKEKDGEPIGNSDSLGYGNEELTERDWSVLLTNATVITYHRGDVVIEENTINSYLYRIKSGTLGVEKRNKDGKSVKIATMVAPKMFGEMSFLGNKTTARIVVDDQADLYVMDIPFLNNLFVSHPRLGAKFYKIMANQLAVRLKNLPTQRPPSQQSPTPSPVSSPHLGSPASSSSSVTSSPPTSPPKPIIPPLSVHNLSVSTNSAGVTSTPPASPRTPNLYLSNLHPALINKRTTTSANFSPRDRADTGLPAPNTPSSRSSTISRTQTSAHLGGSSSGSGGGSGEHMKKNDQEFCQRFSLIDEIVIKDYACSLNRSGRCYISQGHVCFYSKFFGYKTKKVIPFKQITNVLCVNINQLEISRIKVNAATTYRFTFQNNKDRQDAYGIISSLYESSKTSNTSDDLKQKMQQERKKQNLTLKPKHFAKDHLTKEDWELIGREGSRCHTFKKDEPIVKQGERIQKIFQIGKGVCRIEKIVPSTNDPNRFHSVVLGTMKQDDTFGEITYLLSGEVTANVIADSPEVEVYAIEGQFVNILFDLNPSLATKWFKYLATALNKTLIERESQLYNS